MLKEVQKGYVFPRIPLNLTLPEDYPDIGCISNIAVIPEINDFRQGRDEIEIKGSYQVSVSYIKAETRPHMHVGDRVLNCKDFFGQLKLQADGLFSEEEDQESRDVSGELYTVNFTRPFHTFVDLEAVSRSRYHRPFMAVERVHLEPAEGRLLKGELVLWLATRPRRSGW